MSTLERQPDFPVEDLTEKNAVFLLQLMQEPWFLHVAAFENRFSHLEDLYARLSLNPETPITEASQIEHRIAKLALIGSGVAPTKNARASFSYGYTLFESATSVVSPAVQDMTVPAILTTEPIDNATRTMQSLTQHLEAARETFINAQPVSVDFIKASIRLTDSPASEEYALTGAAIRREIELIIRSYRRHFDQ